MFSLTAREPGNTAVSVLSSRPTRATRLLEGKSIGQALTTIPLLFSICSKAQSIAAIRAIESGLEISAGHSIEQRRRQLLDLETLREHLWRVILDWPGFYSQTADATHAARVVRLANELLQHAAEDGACLTRPGLDDLPTSDHSTQHGSKELRAAMERELYAMDLTDWLHIDLVGLQRWITKADTPLTRMLNHVLLNQWQSLGTTDVRFLPLLNPDVLITRLDAANADAFVAQPDWDGLTHYETGALARVADHALIRQLHALHGPGLLVRLVARLVETAQIGVRLAAQPDDAGDIEIGCHSGLGIAEAARGRLYHRAVVRDGNIGYYRVLAPTEWNFHPRGPAVRALGDIDIKDQVVARQQAELLIHAIDPCVEYEIHIGNEREDRTVSPAGGAGDVSNA